MAQQVHVILVDDLDGGEADETVPFSLDGVAYEIDLSKSNAEMLRERIRTFCDAARPQPRRGGAKRVRPPTGRDNKAIRAWAALNDLNVPDRGRIPASVIALYDEAMANGAV